MRVRVWPAQTGRDPTLGHHDGRHAGPWTGPVDPGAVLAPSEGREPEGAAGEVEPLEAVCVAAEQAQDVGWAREVVVEGGAVEVVVAVGDFASRGGVVGGGGVGE